LPARLEVLAAGDAATPAIRGRWELTKRIQADLSARDAALTRLALEPDAPAAFDLGPASRLIESQGGEGNWLIEDFTGPVMATAFALDALSRQGVDDREAAVLRGGEWLRSVQNADGGWGQDEGRDSSPVLTACAVMGLVAGGDAGSESVHRGIDSIVRTQGDDGGWQDGGLNWTLLPDYAGCSSAKDSLTLPLIALNAFLRHSGAGANAAAKGI
jgi:squalene-hopene/tetraprenyl-beta-curcumene cyclase